MTTKYYGQPFHLTVTPPNQNETWDQWRGRVNDEFFAAYEQYCDGVIREMREMGIPVPDDDLPE